MKVAGIVVEYNPFHNGHKYQIDYIKNFLKADYIIVIMSGSFTQNGNVSIYDKYTRAKLAITYGVDLVIELPMVYATSSAQNFSHMSVKILNSLNIIDYLVFGAEEKNIKKLEKIAKILLENEEKIWKDIKEYDNKTKSFAKIRTEVLKNFLNKEEIEIIKKPNNILAIEYIKSIIKLKSTIIPIVLQREENFNVYNIGNNNLKFLSATTIRKEIYKITNTKLNSVDNVDKKYEINFLQDYVPQKTLDIIYNLKPCFNENLYTFIRYKILNNNIENLKQIFEMSEGLEFKIKKEIMQNNTYEKFIDNVKSKRYIYSKINRLLVYTLFNITTIDYNKYINLDKFYIHILAKSKENILLSKIQKNSNNILLTKINDKVLQNLKKDNSILYNLLMLDIQSTNLRSIVENTSINIDYTNKL